MDILVTEQLLGVCIRLHFGLSCRDGVGKLTYRYIHLMQVVFFHFHIVLLMWTAREAVTARQFMQKQ